MQTATLKEINITIDRCTIEANGTSSSYEIKKANTHSIIPHHLMWDNVVGRMVNTFMQEEGATLRVKMVTRLHYYYKKRKYTIQDVEYVHFTKENIGALSNLLTVAVLTEFILPEEDYKKLKELPLREQKTRKDEFVPTSEDRKTKETECAMFVVKLVQEIMKKGDYGLYLAARRLEESGKAHLASDIFDIHTIYRDVTMIPKLKMLDKESYARIFDGIENIATKNTRREDAYLAYGEYIVKTGVPSGQEGDYIDRIMNGERMHNTQEEYEIKRFVDAEVVAIIKQFL